MVHSVCICAVCWHSCTHAAFRGAFRVSIYAVVLACPCAAGANVVCHWLPLPCGPALAHRVKMPSFPARLKHLEACSMGIPASSSRTK